MDTTATSEQATGAPAPAGPRRAPKVAVPGGSARLAAEVRLVPAGRPDEEIVLQALDAGEGAALLRLGYRRAGRTIRGPVSATADELHALLALARAEPALATLLEAPPARRRDGAAE
jgi:hypothetical protein